MLSKLLTWIKTCRDRDTPGMHPLVVLLPRRLPRARSWSMAVVVPRRVGRARPHRPVPRRIPCVIRRRMPHAVGRLFSRGQKWVPRALRRCRMCPGVFCMNVWMNSNYVCVIWSLYICLYEFELCFESFGICMMVWIIYVMFCDVCV